MRSFVQIGYGSPTEVRPGIFEDTIVERDALAEVVQRTEALDINDSIIPTYRTTTSVSVISDGPTKPMYNDIRYVKYQGFKWAITSVVHQPPRVVLYIGEKYNGPPPS